ncbi:ThuA domain-containing protein [Plantactinospora soyae]|uniref:Type 1 glutamine amidotransferase n=1 Tax=Plantactinospora soyae TaxID=1544732 RepID=A0A927M8V0_9ACTN|nr:ThuA domain-containing protein [Plantactinospora soyae]MBE1490308.1 type 1 glutamine amidotransferase [Plantactinospora soyae]
MVAVRDAIVVRGGWDGHVPVPATEVFIPFLRGQGFAVEVHDDLAVYADPDRMAAADLVVQCWSIGTVTEAQATGLIAAVRAGTGFAGWHGGIVGAFHHNAYHQLTGGVFVHHPAGFVDHELTVLPDRAGHPIVRGIGPVSLHTEKYWVLTDPLNDVLATVTFDPGPDPDTAPGADGAPAMTPWRHPVTLPAVWTRSWGAGRVFVSTVGHKLDDLTLPPIRTITERGLLWAARQK